MGIHFTHVSVLHAISFFLGNPLQDNRQQCVSMQVVQDVIQEMCELINVHDPLEMEEFSLYCIVEGDAFTMPLAREEYILDVTTELHKNQQVGCHSEPQLSAVVL